MKAARTKLYVGHALAGAAVAALGVSIYLLISRPKASAAGDATVGVMPLSKGAALTLGGRF